MLMETEQAIKASIEAQEPKAWNRKDLAEFLSSERKSLAIPAYITTSKLIEFLIDNQIASEWFIQSADYGKKSRYVVGNPSPFAFASAFYKNSYLCHGSALYLHGLSTVQTIFVNREQSAKNTTSKLSQRTIDHAFANQPRKSAYVFKTSTDTITFLNGKNTGNAGVIDMPLEGGQSVSTTSLERTLIDCAVRPQYAGGIEQVADAFVKAIDRVSVSEIAGLLKSTRYVYPYHQSIGFLLERAGMSDEQLRPLQELPRRFNFYLDYRLKSPHLDTKWKIYHPHSLGQKSV